MAEPDDLKNVSDLLWTCWQNGVVVNDTPDIVWPESRAEGYAVQALLEQRSAKTLYGWKIAATSEAGQDHINVSGPMAGRLLAEQAYEDSAMLDLAGNHMRVAEPEFAFRFGRDLEPRPEPWKVEEVLERVATLHPAIEVPDSRFEDFTQAGEAKLIADNACAHQFVLGRATDANWRALDLAAHDVQASVVGRYDRAGQGADVLGDPRTALAWLVNEVTGMGETLTTGQVVTTGTCMAPLNVAPGDTVYVNFGVIGSVGLRLVA